MQSFNGFACVLKIKMKSASLAGRKGNSLVFFRHAFNLIPNVFNIAKKRNLCYGVAVLRLNEAVL